MRLPVEVKVYRQGALCSIAKANVSINALGEMSDWIDSNSKENLTLGYVKDLPREHAERTLESLIDDIVKFIHEKCFPEYSVIFDSTPSFANYEAIII